MQFVEVSRGGETHKQRDRQTERQTDTKLTRRIQVRNCFDAIDI